VGFEEEVSPFLATWILVHAFPLVGLVRLIPGRLQPDPIRHFVQAGGRVEKSLPARRGKSLGRGEPLASS